MREAVKKISAIVVFLASSSSGATELFNQEIHEIGSHTGQTIFMYLKSSALRDNGCMYEVLYCPSSNQDCKSMLSIALTAKTTASKIYVNFVKGTDGKCIMDHI